MALDKSLLRDTIVNEMKSQFDIKGEEILQKMATAIANAVIDHFEANAVINTVVSGVMTGSDSANGVGTIT